MNIYFNQFLFKFEFREDKTMIWLIEKVFSFESKVNYPFVIAPRRCRLNGFP